MAKALAELIKDNNYNEIENLEKLYLEKVIVDKKTRRYEIFLKSYVETSNDLKEKIKDIFVNGLKLGSNIDIYIDNQSKEFNLDKINEHDFRIVLRDILKQYPSICSILTTCKYSLKDKSLEFEVDNEFTVEMLKSKHIDKFLKDELYNISNKIYDIKFKFNEIEINEYNKFKYDEDKKIIDKYMQEVRESTPVIRVESTQVEKLLLTLNNRNKQVHIFMVSQQRLKKLK